MKSPSSQKSGNQDLKKALNEFGLKIQPNDPIALPSSRPKEVNKSSATEIFKESLWNNSEGTQPQEP